MDVPDQEEDVTAIRKGTSEGGCRAGAVLPQKLTPVRV